MSPAGRGRKVLQFFQGLSAQGIDRADRKKYTLIRLNVKSGKNKGGGPRLSQPRVQVSRIQGLARGRLDLHARDPGRDTARSRSPSVSGHGQRRRLAGLKHCPAPDWPFGEVSQVFPADLLLQPGVRAGVSGLADRDHVPAPGGPVVARPQVRPDIEGAELLQVLRLHLPGTGPAGFHPGIAAVDVFAVDGRHAGRVDRLFHPALDLEGGDPRVNEVRQHAQNAHVLHGQGIDLFFIGIRPHRPFPVVQDPVGEPAGPRASPPVSAPAAQKAGHEAAARVGIAHGAMDKGLDLDRLPVDGGILPPQGRDLLQRQLSGGDDAADPHAAQVLHRLGGCDRHLGTGVQGQARTGLPQGGHDAQVLDDHAVQALQPERPDKVRQLTQLLLPRQDIGRQVDPAAVQMGLPDHTDQVFI